MTAALMIDNQTATANVPVLDVPVGADRVMSLDQLDLSEKNARKKVLPADVQRMAAFLEAQGQLHPLLVHIGADGRGKVHAGGMRLRGMWLNRDAGKITADFPIKVTVYEEERALELSTAENAGRTAMHHADEIEAFTAMVSKGLSFEQVAARFAVSKLTVERRVKLGNLAPVLLDLFREDKIDMEQLKALSLTNDHAKQVAVWEALPKYDNSAYRIRQMLVDEDQEIDGDSSIAKFVGIENYCAAGGVVRSDLFSDDGLLPRERRTGHRAGIEKAGGRSRIDAGARMVVGRNAFGNLLPGHPRHGTRTRTCTQDDLRGSRAVGGLEGAPT
jgi:ParB family transcriptional regulator, chromosome partitioning protein